MDLNKLYYFYVVAKHQHVTRASEELHIAQPALTKTVKQLENEIGAPLFYKHKRNIFLTPLGEHFKSRLDGVFSIIEKLPMELEEIKEQSKNTVKLNVLAASTAVTEAVVAFKKKNSETVFQIIQNEEELNCDISVTTNTADFNKIPEYYRRCIIEEKIYLAVPKSSDYANLEYIDLSTVSENGFVNLAGSRLFRTICDSFCLSAGFKAKSIFESDSPTAVKNLIGAGVGIGFWPAYSWGKASSDIKLLQIKNPLCQRALIIGLHSNDTPTKLSADFYEFLIEFIQKQQIKSEKTI